MTTTLATDRWAAACELIRAADNLRTLAALNRAHAADMERLRTAEQRWTAVR